MNTTFIDNTSTIECAEIPTYSDATRLEVIVKSQKYRLEVYVEPYRRPGAYDMSKPPAAVLNTDAFLGYEVNLVGARPDGTWDGKVGRSAISGIISIDRDGGGTMSGHLNSVLELNSQPPPAGPDAQISGYFHCSVFMAPATGPLAPAPTNFP